jgi:phage nucleotide-binding protein
MNIESTKDNGERGQLYLVYGEAGVGKTSLAKTLDNPIVIDVEGGVVVLKHDDIAVVRIREDLSNMRDVFDNLDGLDGYGAIILDSLSELEKFMLIALGKRGKNDGVPSLHDYGVVQYSVRDYLRRLRALAERGVDVIVTALEMPLELEQGDGIIRTRLYPLLMKKLAPEICGLFDVVAHMEVSAKPDHEGERFLRLQPTPDIMAKNRYTDDKFWTANLGEFITKVREEN